MTDFYFQRQYYRSAVVHFLIKSNIMLTFLTSEEFQNIRYWTVICLEYWYTYENVHMSSDSVLATQTVKRRIESQRPLNPSVKQKNPS